MTITWWPGQRSARVVLPADHAAERAGEARPVVERRRRAERNIPRSRHIHGAERDVVVPSKEGQDLAKSRLTEVLRTSRGALGALAGVL